MGDVLAKMSFDMIEHAKEKYVGKTFVWRGLKIEIIHCFSCYEGDFFEYRFADDPGRRIERIRMDDDAFMRILD